MKFRDIPQMIGSIGCYRVDMPWAHLEKWLHSHKDLELNPDFQRGHVWTEAQQASYIEFRLRGGRSGRELYFNAPGYSRGVNKGMVCVDGLQRLTAVRRFLSNELRVFGSFFSGYEDPGMMDFVGMNATFSVHIEELTTKAEVLRWYLEMNTGGVIHTDEEIDRVQILLDKELS